jgi:iron complex transport system ATP-binding protein
MSLAVRFSEVSFSYGDLPALQEIDLEIPAGAFIGLVGPNSSGKSTLLRVMSRLLKPTGGHVSLGERPLVEWPLNELARTLAVVASDEHFAFPFSVQQVVLMGRLPHLSRWQRESARDRAVAEETMRETDVWELRERAVQELSSGERQRVLLARALTQEPKLLILDEPTAHLDIGHEWALFKLLKNLHRRKGLTLVCAIHDLPAAARYADRLILLKEGRILTAGEPSQVLTESFLREGFGAELSVEWRGANHKELFLIPTT